MDSISVALDGLVSFTRSFAASVTRTFHVSGACAIIFPFSATMTWLRAHATPCALQRARTEDISKVDLVQDLRLPVPPPWHLPSPSYLSAFLRARLRLRPRRRHTERVRTWELCRSLASKGLEQRLLHCVEILVSFDERSKCGADIFWGRLLQALRRGQPGMQQGRIQPAPGWPGALSLHQSAARARLRGVSH